jgi:hypothetical protein
MIIKDTDPNFKNLLKSFAVIDSIEIKAGHFEKQGKSTKRKNGKADNVLLAIIHNTGSPQRKIPARPFTKPAFDKNQSKYNNIIDKTINSFLEKRNFQSLERNCNLLGKLMQQDIQHEIENFQGAPLKPLTIKRKGSSKPLIDTGEMKNDTDYLTTFNKK